MKRVTLIQLVSAQSMPNLLAAMALNPARIIHCCTPAMEKKAPSLARAYKAAGIKADVIVEPLDRMPQVASLKTLIEHLVEDNGDSTVVLNFTGGTKLMSLGAFAGALKKKICSLYVDTDDGIFVDGQSAPGFSDLFEANDTGLTQVQRRLRVDILAVANGCERVATGIRCDDLIPAANELLNHPDLESAGHLFADPIISSMPRGFHEQKKWDSDHFSQGLLTVPPEIEKLGVDFRLFRRLGLGISIHPETPLKTAEETLKFFHGTWWEIAVFDFLNKQGCYRDLRWSVKVGSRDANQTDMEEDILGVDGVNLLYVSCKRGGTGAKLTRLLEELRASAERIGGSHSRKILAVYRFPDGSQGRKIRQRADELNIDILTGEDVK